MLDNLKLTGKQKRFVTAYLNGANFNATQAAKMAGYKATSDHSFEAIGSENLTRPAIAAAIESFFKTASVGAEECLTELGRLARGNSKDKIRALALLSQHHGLLDGSWLERGKNGGGPIEIIVKHETRKALDEQAQFVDDELKKYKRIQDDKWQRLVDLYRAIGKSEIVAVLQFLRKLMGESTKPDGSAYSVEDAPLFGTNQNEETAESRSVEIIPPPRRLQAAPIERMISEVIDVYADDEPPLISTPKPFPARPRRL